MRLLFPALGETRLRRLGGGPPARTLLITDVERERGRAHPASDLFPFYPRRGFEEPAGFRLRRRDFSRRETRVKRRRADFDRGRLFASAGGLFFSVGKWLLGSFFVKFDSLAGEVRIIFF